jgi:hypothetical protein
MYPCVAGSVRTRDWDIGTKLSRLIALPPHELAFSIFQELIGHFDRLLSPRLLPLI